MNLDNQEPEVSIPAPLRRSSRSMQSRNHEGRVEDARDPLVYAGISRFNLPKSLIDRFPEFRFCWVVYSSGNQETKENYFDMCDKGYQPVRASECPELARHYALSPFAKKEEDELILRGGQILMKASREVAEKWDRYYQERSDAQHTIAETNRLSADGRSPRVFQANSSRVREGRIFG